MECPICHSAKTKKNGTDFDSTPRAQKYSCRNCGYHWRVNDKNSTRRRVLLISDTHCGHLTGLTPPYWNEQSKPFYEFRKESWLWFYNICEQFKPFDYLVFNGDAIDGKQHKQGGRELLTTDRLEQARMAVEVINTVNPKKTLLIRGSKYHVGSDEDFEEIIAERTGTKIYNHVHADLGGKIFDIRHKIGRSGTPYGRLTPLSKQITWNRLKAEKDSSVAADIIVRSHVHYHVSIEESGRLAMTLPALQWVSNYGQLECDGEVDYGLVIIDIETDGTMVKRSILPQLKSMKEQIIEL